MSSGARGSRIPLHAVMRTPAPRNSKPALDRSSCCCMSCNWTHCPQKGNQATVMTVPSIGLSLSTFMATKTAAWGSLKPTSCVAEDVVSFYSSRCEILGRCGPDPSFDPGHFVAVAILLGPVQPRLPVPSTSRRFQTVSAMRLKRSSLAIWQRPTGKEPMPLPGSTVRLGMAHVLPASS